MRKGLLIAVLLAVLTYLGTVQNRFLYDDVSLIVINPAIRSFEQVDEVVSAGRPIRGLSFMLDYKIWGLKPGKWHATNLILHAICAGMFFCMVFRLYASSSIALVAGSIFAVHPAISEAVIGVSHRKEMLAMLFMLLSLHFYLSYLKAGLAVEGGKGKGTLLLLGALASYLLALGSKQVALVTPLMFLVVGHVSGMEKPFAAIKKGLPLFLVMLAVPILAALGGVGDWKLRGDIGPENLISRDYLAVIATGFNALFKYCSLMLYPTGLSVEHYIPDIGKVLTLGTFMGIVTLASIIMIIKIRGKGPAGFGSLWFILNIVMVLNLIPANQVFAERYLYIPSAGFALIIADLVDYCRKREPKYRKAVMWVSGAIFGLSVMVFITKNSGHLAHDLTGAGVSIPLWCAFVGFIIWMLLRMAGPRNLSRAKIIAISAVIAIILAVAPHAIYVARDSADGIEEPLNKLFVVETHTFEDMAKWIHTKEIASFERSFADKSWRFVSNMLFPAIALTIVIIYITRKARAAYGSAVILLTVASLLMLGEMTITRCQTWKRDERLWRDTIRKNPYSFGAHNNLAAYYYKKGEWDKALPGYKKSIRLSPDNPAIWFNLGTTYLMTGNHDSARKSFERTVEMDPEFYSALINLGNLEFQKKRFEAAMNYYDKTIKVQPKSARAHYNRAKTLIKLERMDEAVASCKKALEINKEFKKARKMCGEKK